MNVKPIPKALLGESLVLVLPTTTGTLETPVSNVRVEITQSVSGYSSSDPKNAAEITVWVDHKNSTWAEFPVGAKVKFVGETFEITERKLYSADTPHHMKFKAKRNGDEAV